KKIVVELCELLDFENWQQREEEIIIEPNEEMPSNYQIIFSHNEEMSDNNGMTSYSPMSGYFQIYEDDEAVCVVEREEGEELDIKEFYYDLSPGTFKRTADLLRSYALEKDAEIQIGDIEEFVKECFDREILEVYHSYVWDDTTLQFDRQDIKEALFAAMGDISLWREGIDSDQIIDYNETEANKACSITSFSRDYSEGGDNLGRNIVLTANGSNVLVNVYYDDKMFEYTSDYYFMDEFLRVMEENRNNSIYHIPIPDSGI
ncbi:MAG: hypothetical protein Q4C00_07480, partial [Bacillota bacterium]|nr:hypothetical protein [Bacillota bacterium]